MALPARNLHARRRSSRRVPAGEDIPSTDPHEAVLAYRRERAKRNARITHLHEQKVQHMRFYTLMLFLCAVVLSLTLFLLQGVRSLFGL